MIYLLPYYKLCNAKKPRTHIKSQYAHMSFCVHTSLLILACGKVMLNGRRRSQQLCAQFCVQSKTKLLRLRGFCFSAIGIVYAEKYLKTIFVVVAIVGCNTSFVQLLFLFFVLFTTTTVRRSANHARSVFL